MDYHGYYGWDAYWAGPFAWGAYPYPYPSPATSSTEAEQPAGEEKKEWDPNLRSAEQVHGYHIQASDDEIGHVEDFIIDDVTWAIRYLIVDTRNWWPGKKVLVSPRWLERVSFEELKMFVNLTREEVKQAPEFTSVSALNREYEAQLNSHYGREGYWISEDLTRDPATSGP